MSAKDTNPIEKMITKLEDTLDPLLDPKAHKAATTLTEDECNLLKKTTLVMTQVIEVTQGGVTDAPTEKFKKMPLERLDTFKERHALLTSALEKCAITFEAVNVMPLALPDKPSLSHYLFGLCNEGVETLYTYINHYKQVDAHTVKLVKESIKAIERLREDLAAFL